MKTVVITGASDGIGAELARQLAAQHRSQIALVLAARNLTALQQVAQACTDCGAQALVVPTDVAVQAQCQQLIEQAVQRFGRIDMLINNAGISAQAQLSEVHAQDLQWYEQLMRINFWGSLWCTHAALPQLQASRGRIVAVSSLAGLVGLPGRTAYSSSKFAMSGFFEALRAELKPSGVSITIAYPGVVDTRIRHRGFNARGQAAGVSGLKEEGAMTVQTCARLILQAAERRERELVMTAKGRLGRWLKLLAPGLVEKMALAAFKDEARPHGA